MPCINTHTGSIISDVEKDLSVRLVFLDGPIESRPHPAVDGIYEGILNYCTEMTTTWLMY
jgi:hypothetical protein